MPEIYQQRVRLPLKYNTMHTTPPDFEHERSFLITLESNFSKRYNFSSVEIFKQVVEERFAHFKIEVRQTILDLNNTDRHSYLDELLSEIKLAIESFELHTLDKFTDIQHRFANAALRYVSEQQKRYGRKHPADIAAENLSSLSFLYRESDTDALIFIYKHLNEVLDFINIEKTSLAVFIEIFTTPDLMALAPNKQIWFNCQTTEAAYILRQMQGLFDELTFSNIGKSVCFFSRNGILLTTSNLRQSSRAIPKTKEVIDEVMRKVMRF